MFMPPYEHNYLFVTYANKQELPYFHIDERRVK